MTHRLVRQFLNVSGSVLGDYGRTAVDMVCPNCAKVVKMKVTTAHLICPECKHKVSRWRTEPSQTVTLSERDVARVLQAITKTEDWSIYTALTRHLARSTTAASPTTTPEGWPVPSHKLMEEIAKLL